MTETGRSAAVVIGLNEGERLVRCLRSVAPLFDLTVYVDSGSDDGSPEAAAALGAEVIELDMTRPFTAARARNAGVAALPADVAFVQFIDGDCELAPGWPNAARAFLAERPDVAAVAGALAARAPEESVYNRLCAEEWRAPAGEARACGGIAMMRLADFRAVGGFREDMPAGEEPELCLRLRRAGRRIWRLDAPMATHDAAMTRFGQWCRRARRAGRAYAAGARLHGLGPERHYVRETVRALAWGAAAPLAIVAGLFATPWAAALALIYPAQVARLALRRGGAGWDWTVAAFQVMARFPEALGVVDFALGRRARYAKPAPRKGQAD